MDGLSTAASVIAVIQLTGNIVKICGSYVQEVKDARNEILAIQQAVTGLERVLQQLKELLQGPSAPKLSISQTIDGDITKCSLSLASLEKKIDGGRRQKGVRRLGLRALGRPLKIAEVEKVVSDLERYKSSFTLCLMIDQMTHVTDMNDTIDRIDRHTDLEKLPAAYGAEFDSYTNQYEDYCLPGTRTELLRQITEWARLPLGKCFFWLNGKAGTGKSTISRTVAKSFREANLLGASFFFKRGEGDRGTATKFFPTIARQLSTHIPELIPRVRKAIHDDSDIATKTLMEQFDKLLLQPLLSVKPSASSVPTIAIVVDALDECEVDNDVRLILQLLPLLQKSNSVHLRIFLTSRPELPIRLGFSNMTNNDYEDLVLHDIPEATIESDISLFLNHRLFKIRSDRSLPINWPGDTNIKNLVELSVPLFIFAATMCRIFEDPHWDPVDSLSEILTHRIDGSKLDGTYLPVLNRLLNGQSEKQKKQLVQTFQEVIGVIVILESPLSVTSLSRLIGIPERVVHLRLNPLHSVLSVPNDKTVSVRLFHLSFRDFLLDSETREKTPFWVDKREMHYRLTTRCLLMCQNLRRNICGLPGNGTRRAEIDRRTVDHCLPPELQYACRYWAHHLVRSVDLDAVINNCLIFLQKHFLHWMEAMSLLGLASEVVGIISLLQTAVTDDTHYAMTEFLHDAKRFVLKNCQMADNAPLQLYCSGLIFAPRKAIIRRQFETEMPTCIHQLPLVEETWSAELQTLEGHCGSIESVTFSPDGQLLASGSHDKTIRLWYAATGALQKTLNGHSSWVRAVTFSPDGRLLASGSYDQTVLLWDTVTGALQQNLKGHSDSVQSVAFSPDGRLLASGSYDQTVQLWDPATGALQQTLEGHTDSVRSVAFSPNGQLLASGSDDVIVRLWDTITGAPKHTLKGHSSCVRSVAFSPDGWLLASGSVDGTVRLWNSVTGTLQMTLANHSSCVRSVAFSPNGHLLASGSNDEAVRLWDFVTGTLQLTLDGHSDSVDSVTFSPDGHLLASSSYDKTIKLWYTAADALQGALEGHSSWAQSMVFSPDRRLLASGSHDKTIRLWDTATGALRQTLSGHKDLVRSVVFSPDGRLLASGSDDKTVRLWDTATGSLQQTFKGHLDWVQSVGFSPNDILLASGSDDKTVRLYNTSTGALQQILEDHTDSVQSLSFSPFSPFSPNGLLLASGSYDEIIRLWDATTGALHKTLQGHSGSVESVAFSPDGQLLASGSQDETVRFWTVETGALQQNLRTNGAVTSLEFSQDGSYLSTNLGTIYTQLGNVNPKSPGSIPKILIWQSRWITLNGEEALWLPPEFRSSRSTTRDGVLALEHSGGRIIFLGFHV